MRCRSASSPWRTGAELLIFDEQEHPVERQALAIDGTLLWADAQGLVVGREDSIVLYGVDGEERLSVSLPPTPDGEVLRPQYVRPDPERGGLFVLADAGVPADVTNAAQPTMSYVVR